MENQHSNNAVAGKLFMAIAIVISAFLLAGAWERSHYSNANKKTIAVTGSAQRNFTSDLIVWQGSFSKRSMNLKEAYSLLNTDNEIIRKYLIKKGVKEDEIKFSSITINRQYDYRYNDKGMLMSSNFTGYELVQNVTIESNDVDKVEKISREVTELINDNIELFSSNPSYFYTQLAGLKHEILKDATTDAKIRAETLANNAGSRLRKLVKSSMGVFQITGQNTSEDFSYGGAFNTSSKNKTITVTVNLEYSLE
ncbi:MAG: SIMPL domain-containing protein [Bacteroidia bacterium]